MSVITQTSLKLVSVVLCDVLAQEFNIKCVSLIECGGYVRPLLGTRTSIGEGLLLNQSINQQDKIQVKVCVCVCVCCVTYILFRSHSPLELGYM